MKTLVERLVFFFRSITMVFHNNFPPAVRSIFCASPDSYLDWHKRILAAIGARREI
ncbi:hypothetical protein D3C85_818500 [compost metagenome]